MVYHYRTPAGVFWIVQQDQSVDWWLGILHDGDQHALGIYLTAERAAAAVGGHRTGWEPWDKRKPEAGEAKTLDDWAIGPIT